jgi:hypothetical protein
MTDQENTPGTETEKPEMTAETVLKGFVDHQANAVREAVKAVDALLPEGFKRHANASLHETVKSYRLLFDAGLEALNRAGKGVDEALRKAKESVEDENDERPSTTGATKVRVEVE